jgi:uncharacterized membrane protein
MELIPIIFKILACCVILFLVVLMVSFVFTKNPKQEQVDYKKLVEERKIAYSEQKSRMNTNLVYSEKKNLPANFHNKVTGETASYYSNNRLKQTQQAREHVKSDFVKKRDIPFDNKPRYTVLNETMSIEPQVGNKEVQIFYPINFQRSA